jgi:hypothetical protein
VSQDSAARLERRARTLLRAYPADYRRDRADELIGTLLEATPAGRSFPSARDARALIAGGVRARAARNRRLTTTTNLRLALLLGLSIALAFNLLVTEIIPNRVDWLALATGLFGIAAALAPWLGRRTATTAIVLPAAALLAYQTLSSPFALRGGGGAWVAGILIVMTALAVLSGGPERLPRSWLWLPCLPLAGLAASALLSSPGVDDTVIAVYVPGCGILLLAAVVVCWTVTDARPAFGLVAGVVLTLLLWDLATLPSVLRSTGYAILVVNVLPLAIGLAIMLPLAWLLRRRAASSSRPLPKP